MQINVTFLGIKKSTAHTAHSIRLSASAPAHTTYLPIPVDLGMTVGCVVEKLVSLLETTEFSVSSYINIPYSDEELKSAIVNTIVEGRERAQPDKLKLTLRSLYGDSAFACSEPVAWYELKFIAAPISVVLHDNVPTFLE